MLSARLDIVSAKDSDETRTVRIACALRVDSACDCTRLPAMMDVRIDAVMIVRIAMVDIDPNVVST